MRPTAILFIALLLLAPCLAQADISPWMSYQGVLRDGSGDLVPDGIYTVVFNIYTVQTGGTSLWVEGHTLTATDGIINAYLGSIEPLSGLAFDVPYWLGIAVDGEAQLVPRTALTTVPYAAHAGYADTCLEGDEDWAIDGDNVYHEAGHVGIGTAVTERRLEVRGGDEPLARFWNGAGTTGFAVEATNAGGTAGAFFAGDHTSMYPGIPAAVYGRGAAGFRGAHFSAVEQDALYAYSTTGRAIYGMSSSGYAGYFTGGLGVHVNGALRTNSFRMATSAYDGYVLTSDATGNGTWQPAGAGGDSDWTINGSDMYSTPAGNVGIGESTPAAKLEVNNGLSGEALVVKHGGATASRMVNIERTVPATTGNDILQLKVPSGSADDFQFIEAENGGANTFIVDGDGSITAAGKLEVSGTEEKQAEVSTSSVTSETRAVSGIVTGTGSSDAVGVYGRSIPDEGWGVGGLFEGGYIGVYAPMYPTGGGGHQAVYGYISGGSGTNYGVVGQATSGSTNYGVYGTAGGGSTNYAGYFDGNAHVTSTFTAGIKSFRIDHPLDPESKYLLHSCVESDEMMNVYNGNVTLDQGGEAWIEMPEWFEALNQDFRYQLTCIGGFAPVYVAEEVSGNRFMVAGGEPGMKISWQVTGVRHDPLAEASRVVVEQDKPANEVGKYMHPDAYGMPVTAGVDYNEEWETRNKRTAVERTPRPVRDRSDGD